MLGFAHQERKRWDERAWWVLVAGEGPEPGNLASGGGRVVVAVIETERKRRTPENHDACGGLGSGDGRQDGSAG